MLIITKDLEAAQLTSLSPLCKLCVPVVGLSCIEIAEGNPDIIRRAAVIHSLKPDVQSILVQFLHVTI